MFCLDGAIPMYGDFVYLLMKNLEENLKLQIDIFKYEFSFL